MATAIELRDDYDAQTLRELARRSRDARQVRRLLALAAAYEGASRGEAAATGGMDRQTLRDWALRFNAEGPEGMISLKGAGAKPKLKPHQLAALIRMGLLVILAPKVTLTKPFKYNGLNFESPDRPCVHRRGRGRPGQEFGAGKAN